MTKLNREALQAKLVTALQARETAAKALESSDIAVAQKAFAKASREVGDANDDLENSYNGGPFDFDWGW